ncbi:MAG: hypothetical protein ABMA64_16180 [Myxococcota bacterium]
MTPDGGQVAITGFKLQVVIALIDSLREPDWIRMTIEPPGLDHVDVLWVYTDDEVDHVQVKHSKNTFKPGLVKRVTKAMAARPERVRQRRLVLLGPGQSEPVSNGVAVVYRVNDLDALLADAAMKAGLWVESRGLPQPPSAVREGVQRAAERLLWLAGGGRTWSRDDVVRLLWDEVVGHPDHSEVPTAPLVLEIRRTVVIHSDGRGDDYVRCLVRNPTDEPRGFRKPFFHFTLTDPGTATLVRVGDGEPGVPRAVPGKRPGGFAVGLELRAPVPARDSRMYAVHLQRSPVAALEGREWVFSDPLTETGDEAHPFNVDVIFPVRGVIRAARTAAISPMTASWRLVTGPEDRPVRARLTRPRVSKSMDRAAAAGIAAAERDLDAALAVYFDGA